MTAKGGENYLEEEVFNTHGKPYAVGKVACLFIYIYSELMAISYVDLSCSL